MLLQLAKDQVAAEARAGRDVDRAVGASVGCQVTISRSQSTLNSSNSSWISRFGVQASIWTQTAVRDRPLRLMRGDDAIVGVDHPADHPRRQDAAEVGRIRLEDVDRVVCEQFGELVRGGEALAGRDRDRQLRARPRAVASILAWSVGSSNQVGSYSASSIADLDRLGDTRSGDALRS